MYELTIEAHFCSAHNLRDYEGACERLHGHNWHVEVSVEAAKLDHRGISVDFKVLKKETSKIVDDRLDHRYLNDIEPFDKLNTTAENLAKYLFDELSGALNDGNLRVSRIKVWETEKCAASYYE